MLQVSLLIRRQLTDRAKDFHIILDDVSIVSSPFPLLFQYVICFYSLFKAQSNMLWFYHKVHQHCDFPS